MEWTKLNLMALPTENDVLVSNGEYVLPAEFGKDGDNYYFHNSCGMLYDVTHWMLLPKPPKM